MNAIIYARFSPRPNVKECDSCKKQTERCEAYAKSQGYQVVRFFFDDAVSGGDLDRGGLQGLLDYLQQTAKDSNRIVVIMDCVDRLARDMLINLTIRQQIEQAHGVLEFADGTPNGNSPEARFFMNMMSAVAAYERDRVRYRTSRGIKKRQANGEHFGRVPIGYKRDPQKGTNLLVNLEERKAIMTARRLSFKGMSSEDIASELSFLYEFRGGHWKARTVRKMITKKHRWEKALGEE